MDINGRVKMINELRKLVVLYAELELMNFLKSLILLEVRCPLLDLDQNDQFITEFLKDIPNFNNRLAVRPGITGWAQVNGGYELTPKEKLEYDIYYIQHESAKLDFIVLLKTIKVIFNGHGFR